MAYENIHLQSGNLQKTTIKKGGFCTLTFIKHEDVLTWPTINPATGICNTSIALKPGGSFIQIEAIEKDRTVKEDLKEGAEGPYHEYIITGTMAGQTTGNILSVQAMKYHQWVIIAKDRYGIQRLYGNEDAGCRFKFSHALDDNSGVPKYNLQWGWQHANGAPIYAATVITIISSGGNSIAVGCMTLIARFKVGAAGAPMNDGDTVFTHAGLANKKILFITDGLILPVDDGSGAIVFTNERHVQKTLASNTATVAGGMVLGETTEIYAYT